MNQKKVPVPVCVSFRGTLAALQRGTLTEADLDRALFYFGCTKVHAITPGSRGETVEPEVRMNGGANHQLLVAALEKAEASGRVAWRTAEESNSLAVLHALMVKNGVRPGRNPERHFVGCYGNGNYELVVDACGNAELSKDVTVIR